MRADMSLESDRVHEKKSRLYNPGSFILLAFLLSFILSGILFALNAGRISGPKVRNRLLILFAGIGAIVATALFLFVNKTNGLARLGFYGLNIAAGGLLLHYSIA